MPFVLDASATAGWCLADEASDASDLLLERLAREGGVVPALWRWEVANMLIFAERRDRIDAPTVGERLELLDEFPIEIDTEAFLRGWSTTLAIARAEEITAYDAAYLDSLFVAACLLPPRINLSRAQPVGEGWKC